jgi:hypothetical protein
MIMIGEDDYSFVAAALCQLHPVHRPVFTALLQVLLDPVRGRRASCLWAPMGIKSAPLRIT